MMTTEQQIDLIYLVPACNLNSLEAKLAKLNKRAARLKVSPIHWTAEYDHIRHKLISPHSGDTCWHQEGDDQPAHLEPTGESMAWYRVHVEGEHPHYQGWRLVAVLDPIYPDNAPAANLIKEVPGQHCPDEFRDQIGRCDHCGKKRRRSQTFVLAHEDGGYKMVGRSCIADFLGSCVTPAALAARAEWLREIEEAGSDDEPRAGHGLWGDALTSLLAWAASAIEHRGWLSKSAAEQQGGASTASIVITCLHPSPYDSEHTRRMRDELKPTDAHRQQALDAIAWAQALVPEPDNTYLQNIKLIAGCEWCLTKNSGLAVSIMAAHQRYLGELKRQEIKQWQRLVSQYVGSLKERIELTLTCQRIISMETMFGTSGLHLMLDEQGNELVWFASSSAAWLEVLGTYHVKATVIGHEERNGIKQTKVNRVTILKRLEEESK